LLLAVGTTAGVVAFSAVTVVAARKRVRLRPNLDHRHPMVRRLARQGAWAAMFLALSQVLLVVMLQISNRREGGVAVYQLAWVLYLLPHSLFAVPVMTTRFPTMSRQLNAEDWQGFADSLARGVRSISFLTLPSTALLIALATPVSRLVVHGRAAARLPEIADAVAGFAPGILGFGLLLFFTRGCYAQRDARTPTLANLGVAVVGALAMYVVADQVAGRYLVASLGICSAVATTLGAVALGVVLHRRLHDHASHARGAIVAVVRNTLAATAAGVAAWLVARALVDGILAGHGTFDALVQVVTGSIAAVGVYLVAQTVLGGPAPLLAVRSMGAAARGDGGR
jgi:putative peptidoglycan lipid II flippase